MVTLHGNQAMGIHEFPMSFLWMPWRFHGLPLVSCEKPMKNFGMKQ